MWDDHGRDGWTNTHEDGTRLDGLYPVADDDHEIYLGTDNLRLGRYLTL
jgi:hypothetical protein